MAAAKKNEKKSPSLVGFKPSSDDLKKLDDLIKHYEGEITLSGVSVTATQVLKMALYELHKTVINNPKKRYGAK